MPNYKIVRLGTSINYLQVNLGSCIFKSLNTILMKLRIITKFSIINREAMFPLGLGEDAQRPWQFKFKICSLKDNLIYFANSN